MREVYDSPRLRWPLEMTVSLNQRTENLSPRFSAMFKPVAESGAVTLNSISPPAATPALQANAAEPAYRDAVSILMGRIVAVEAAGASCADQAGLESEITAAYHGWVSRNAQLVNRIRALQRELYIRDMGRTDMADEVMNLQTTMALNSLDEMPAEELSKYCRSQVRAMTSPRSDLDAVGAAQLAIVDATPSPAPKRN
jgi:hypothetical protein